MIKTKLQFSVKVSAVFLLYAALLMTVVARENGFLDEMDNFLGGMFVARGQLVYVDFISQHMPFMYYISAFFNLIGINYDFHFRIMFYTLAAIIFTVMYFRYKDSFGKITMLIMPALYIINMVDIFSTSVLSDQAQALGLVILLLEFIMFVRTREMKIDNAIAVAVAISLSFGTAFVAIYAVFAIALGVMIIEMVDAKKYELKFFPNIGRMFKKYWKLIVFSAAPFIILIVFYTATGHLRELYWGIYKVNSAVYSKYIGGMGSNALKMFVEPIRGYYFANINAFNGLGSSFMENFKTLCCTAINIAFFIKIRKIGIIPLCTMIYFTFMSGIRGFGTFFHAMPYYGVTTFMAAYLINAIITEKKITQLCIVFLCLGVFSTPYFEDIGLISNFKEKFEFNPIENEESYEHIINKLTPEDENFFLVGVLNGFAVNSQRITQPCASSVPWMYEVYAADELESLKRDKPKVAYYSEGYSVWNFKLTDYAPAIVKYIDDNYTQFLEYGLTNLYIRNDYVNQAYKKLGLDSKITKVLANGNEIYSDVGNETVFKQSVEISDDEICGLGIKIGTYARKNKCNLTLKVTDELTNKVVFEKVQSAVGFKDNQLQKILFDNLKLDKGKRYTFEFGFSDMDEKNNLAVYIDRNEQDESVFFINDEEIQGSIAMCLYGNIA